MRVMDRRDVIRFGTPLVLAVSIVAAVIILGVASQNPDGFEWSLFDFAGFTEPEGGFGGIWSFLGDGVAADATTGIIGIIAIFFLGYGLFWVISRRDK